MYTVEKNNDTRGTNQSSNENLKIGLSTNPENPIAGQPTQLNVSFIDNQTNSIEEHVDYKVTIMKGETQVFTTPLLHAADGSIIVPYQFQDSGSYNVMVEVDGIWFMPISDTAQFTVNVG
ncbi:hypothetical protein [Candidatus Nitrosotalea sp. TS]|uniref:hypothetical protein n=1 Tax=Candidatus Nitrosotalea sp. TS TaxID=2341020 RepID=UPI00140E2D5E|nr:hypothetical protein [Candidatus Nitrosotalea sp. TS]